MCKKNNLEQALRGLSLIMNPLCNTVALQSMAPLYNDTDLAREHNFRALDFSSTFLSSSEGYFKISRSKYRFYNVRKIRL